MIFRTPKSFDSCLFEPARSIGGYTHNGVQLPLYQFGLTSWLDGMTSSSRAWLSGKLKILDPHRHVWKSGKSSVFPFIIAASGEAIIHEDWFPKMRQQYLEEFIFTSDGKPRIFVYPRDNPQISFCLRKGSLSGDGSCLRKDLGLSGGSSAHNKCCLFCDVGFGMHSEKERLRDGEMQI